MHVLIYTFNRFAAEAGEHARALRAEGHSVGMRNARYFDGKLERCDRVVCDWAASKAKDAYRAAGVPVEVVRSPAAVTTPPDVPVPLHTADAGVRPTQAKRRGRPRKALA